MICPSWTASRTQPIALSDVVEILDWCCRDAETTGRVCEVGGPDVFTYRDMMRVTARVLGRRRPMLPVPFVTPSLSELWVSLVTGTPRALVAPLIESLRHPMLADDRWLQRKMGQTGLPFEEALRSAVEASRLWRRPVVRSVQRFPCPPGETARSVGRSYPEWLMRKLRPVLHVDWRAERLQIFVRGLPGPVLVLRANEARSSSDRLLFEIEGGSLARPAPRGNPRLEFRSTAGGRYVLAALQDFEPRLPWWLYTVTQAPVHAWIMHAFGRALRRRARPGEPGSASPPGAQH
jgi:hypothetical protein